MINRILQGERHFIQQLYRPVSDTGEQHTLGDLVKEIIPDAYPVSGKTILGVFIWMGFQTPKAFVNWNTKAHIILRTLLHWTLIVSDIGYYY